MKVLIIVLTALFSLNTFALEQCTPAAQVQIDSILSQISKTQDEIKKVDLEFAVRQVSHDYSNCRKALVIEIERNIASVELPAMEIESDPEALEIAREQELANLEIEAVLKLK
jgi:hypothetical protein